MSRRPDTCRGKTKQKARVEAGEKKRRASSVKSVNSTTGSSALRSPKIEVDNTSNDVLLLLVLLLLERNNPWQPNTSLSFPKNIVVETTGNQQV